MSPHPDRCDILAIAAHRDDVEQTCGGTLLRAAAQGFHTAILDLTAGEAGTRGNAEQRAAEAVDAATLLGVAQRHNAGLKDGAVENTYVARIEVARVIRALQPRVVILPYWQARHPDHATASTLGSQACFVAGLSKVETEWQGAPQQAHRPFKIVYASLYADVRPSFVIDITPYIEQRHRALMAYVSQYANQAAGTGLFVDEREIRDRTFAEARHYGLLAGVTYGEPFVQKEVGLVDDLMQLPVQSI